jgi:hypothetical protein
LRAWHTFRAGRSVTREHNVERRFMAGGRVLLGIKGGHDSVEAKRKLRHDGNSIVRQSAVDPILDKRGDVEGNPVPLVRQRDRCAA